MCQAHQRYELPMHGMLAACGGFLLAVLWFDLMFDVQALPHTGDVLPEPVLASIAAYYRRVTTDAFPMNRLVAAVMLVTIAGSVYALAHGSGWRDGVALVSCVAPIALAAVRVFPNAVRLATRADSLERQSALARAICYDHIACVAAIGLFVLLQLTASAAAQ